MMHTVLLYMIYKVDVLINIFKLQYHIPKYYLPINTNLAKKLNFRVIII